jgi:hypothetical protein
MEAYPKNYVELKMSWDELEELNEFLETEVDDGDFVCPSLIDEEWLNEFNCFFKDYSNIDAFIIILKV